MAFRFFTPFFSAVYNQERLISQTIGLLLTDLFMYFNFVPIGYQSSPERKSSKQNNSSRAVNSEHENDTDMEIENVGSTIDVN